MPKRKRYTAQDKARMALAALGGQVSVDDLATHNDIHPTLIHKWRRLLMRRAADLFERGSEPNDVTEIGNMRKKIKDLEQENGFLSRALSELDPAARRAMVDPGHTDLSVARQCRLLSVPRSSFYASGKRGTLQVGRSGCDD